jgi:hypothetical protein
VGWRVVNSVLTWWFCGTSLCPCNMPGNRGSNIRNSSWPAKVSVGKAVILCTYMYFVCGYS